MRELIGALARSDRENEYVIYLTADAPAPDTCGDGRFELRRTAFKSGRRAARILWEQTILPRAAGRDRLDVLHCPGYVMPVLASVPAVVTIHDVIALSHPSLCKRANAAHYRRLIPLAVRRARKVVVSSRATRAELRRHIRVGGNKLAVVHPGVADLFKRVRDKKVLERVRRKHSLPERYILFVGNIEPKKNLPVILAALHRLKERHRTTCKLVVAGKRGWKCRPVFQSVRRLGLEKDVTFTGYIPREDMPAVYTMADVFVMPSIVEGFGMPVVEAMACGVPVITSRAPALMECGGDAAVHVPHEDVVQLSIAIRKVLANSFFRKSLSKRGRERARAFSWKRTAREMLSIYSEAAGS